MQAAFLQGVLLNPQAPITLLAPLNSAFFAFLDDAGLSLDQLLANPSLLGQVATGFAVSMECTIGYPHNQLIFSLELTGMVLQFY